MNTRRFVDKFGDAVREHSDEAAKRTLDKFEVHVRAKRLAPQEYGAKLERVAGKLLQANPDIDVRFVSRHAPQLGAAVAAMAALKLPPAPVPAPRVNLVIQHEDSHRAAEVLAQAEHSAAQRLHGAKVRAAHMEAAAADKLADSKTQLAEAQSAVMKLEIAAAKLAADVHALTRARTAALSGLNARVMHRFAAGGCVFTLSALALEKHAPSYLSALANGELEAHRDARGAISVDNVTAGELRDLCHFFETGERIGALSVPSARAHALAVQYGSPALLEAITEPEPEPERTFDPTKLDPNAVSQYCRTPEIDAYAQRFAQTLIAELDPDSWAHLAVSLDVRAAGPYGGVPLRAGRVSHLPDIRKGVGMENDSIEWRRVCLALVAADRWMQAAGAPPAQFSGTPSEDGSLWTVTCTFDA